MSYHRRQRPPMTLAEKLFMALVIATGGIALIAAIPFFFLWEYGKAAVAAVRRRRLFKLMTKEQRAAYQAITSFGRVYHRRWHLYLETEWWASLRRVVLARARGRCEECGRAAPWLEVHHRHYQTLCFEDPDRDLDALCSWCHGRRPRMLGQRLRIDPTPGRIEERSQPDRRRVTSRPVEHDDAGIAFGDREYADGPGDRCVDPAWVFHDPDDGAGF